MSRIFDKHIIQEEVEYIMSGAQALAVLLDEERYEAAREYITDYVRYLLSSPKREGRKYQYLANFLDWYGRHFLLAPIKEILAELTANQRVTAVELGPGTGWLINSLGDLFPSRYAVDRRPKLFRPSPETTFLEIDLEKDDLPYFSRGSIFIANQFLHCIDNPKDFVGNAQRLPWLVVEPVEGGAGMETPFPYWHEQMRAFGATPLTMSEISDLFVARHHLHASRYISGQWISLWLPV